MLTCCGGLILCILYAFLWYLEEQPWLIGRQWTFTLVTQVQLPLRSVVIDYQLVDWLCLEDQRHYHVVKYHCLTPADSTDGTSSRW